MAENLEHTCNSDEQEFIMARDQIYENLVKTVSTLRMKLLVANELPEIHDTISAINGLMISCSKDPQCKEVHGAINDIIKLIKQIQVFDSTRAKLFEMLGFLIIDAIETISNK